MSSRRSRRLKYALERALQARKVSGQQLERILGHTTFASLLECSTLSIPHTVYTFIRKHYDGTAHVWKSVREELQALLGVLPTMRAQLTRAWQTEVYSADACEQTFLGL